MLHSAVFPEASWKAITPVKFLTRFLHYRTMGDSSTTWLTPLRREPCLRSSWRSLGGCGRMAGCKPASRELQNTSSMTPHPSKLLTGERVGWCLSNLLASLLSGWEKSHPTQNFRHWKLETQTEFSLWICFVRLQQCFEFHAMGRSATVVTILHCFTLAHYSLQGWRCKIQKRCSAS